MKLLTVAEAAETLNVSAATVRALCARRLIRHERIGTGRGAIRVPEDAIEEYRKSRTVEVNGGGGEKVTKTARPRPSYQDLEF